ncbi:putative enoyl-CoA hydratase echA8 [Tritonibacter multivorans]|uniref:3-hydroxyisobutyryl-CoA hydrolase n=1 Tax=Tritonibacter multivorans TaxID=928856 RepID=A0A0P1GI35_9RHOB|nr:enoyl-CoA hydratase/isomerase family protein [Tritonibacter multivorans]MDA7420388.1 enoyl-CoA hydratase/isomerase family protein [Tritonibacter multivorans]CUH81688.1 putative enoyl-CoA hydratase echA8 [Tritonibacter multivorans]SFC41509.1 Enoyl-CoA hydratase/carnithine racemase [Tritonibacter multivorans]
MSDIDIRVIGHAGRITLTRAGALNALTHDMCLAVDAALKAWRNDARVTCIVMDADGEKAFCAGGDIAELYARGTAGDFAHGQDFWRDEYRMNARISEYPKPVVSFLQGFTMGGGVGLGCHGSHRIVGAASRIAMPEVGIGLVPDVGGSHILATAPGLLGDYLGLTGFRMGPGDAILAGFADHYIPEAQWPALISALEETGDVSALAGATIPAPDGKLPALADSITAHFASDDLEAITASLRADPGDFATATLASLSEKSPLAMAATLAILRDLRRTDGDLRAALKLEYRFTYRAQEQADFLEGIRALIIDKDKAPRWKHAGVPVPKAEVDALLAPLGPKGLTFEEEE